LFDLHQGMVKNEHQYVTKMALIANMGGLWGHFPTIFWIVEYLQGQFTFEIKYQNTLCLDVTWIFNLSLYI
jgi:hypothetical protein